MRYLVTVVQVGPEAFEMHHRLLHWPLDLATELADVRSQLARWRGRYLSQLKADSAALIADLAELQVRERLSAQATLLCCCEAKCCGAQHSSARQCLRRCSSASGSRAVIRITW